MGPEAGYVFTGGIGAVRTPVRMPVLRERGQGKAGFLCLQALFLTTSFLLSPTLVHHSLTFSERLLCARHSSGTKNKAKTMPRVYILVQRISNSGFI